MGAASKPVVCRYGSTGTSGGVSIKLQVEPCYRKNTTGASEKQQDVSAGKGQVRVGQPRMLVDPAICPPGGERRSGEDRNRIPASGRPQQLSSYYRPAGFSSHPAGSCREDPPREDRRASEEAEQRGRDVVSVPGGRREARRTACSSRGNVVEYI